MNKILVVLTLEQHRHGVWITRLLESLEQQKQQLLTKGDSSQPWTTVQVVALESIFPMDPNTSFESIILQQSLPQQQQQQQQQRGNEEEETKLDTNNSTVVVGIINRVSDAAPPDLAQLCTALLQLAAAAATATASPRIPIFNGPTSYSLCTNKWCHHALFRQANLSCPATRVILNLPVIVDEEETDTTTSTPTPQQRRLLQYRQQIKQASQQLLEQDKQQQQQQLPLLIKPNGGGFGAGIVRLSTLTDVDQLELPQGGGGGDNDAAYIQLVQAYQAPQDQYIYRIWLLCGHVQCAMRRRITSIPPPPPQESAPTTQEEVSTPHDLEFTSGCAGGSACAWKPKGKSAAVAAATTTKPQVVDESPFEIWQVPEEVRRELEEQLMPILPSDFHAGSVEFLYDTATTTTANNIDDDATLKASRNRLYFDLNLLSTLPIGAQEQQLLLQSHQDVWAELAVAIIATVVSSLDGA